MTWESFGPLVVISIVCLWTLVNLVKNIHIHAKAIEELERKVTVLDKINRILSSTQAKIILEIKDDLSPQGRALLELTSKIGDEEE